MSKNFCKDCEIRLYRLLFESIFQQQNRFWDGNKIACEFKDGWRCIDCANRRGKDWKTKK